VQSAKRESKTGKREAMGKLPGLHESYEDATKPARLRFGHLQNVTILKCPPKYK